jgi:hypothetical protein
VSCEQPIVRTIRARKTQNFFINNDIRRLILQAKVGYIIGIQRMKDKKEPPHFHKAALF